MTSIHRSIFQFLFFSFFLLLISACGTDSSTTTTEVEQPTRGNPPAKGFNEADSDAKAITIADEVMIAMGGRMTYDTTRYLKWNFFGARTLTWDKFTNDVRIEVPKTNTTILVNTDKLTGRVKVGDRELTKADSLDQYLQKGKEYWINDAYWLVMPFKLKDSGVTLKYNGTDTTATGSEADVLQLTFEEVGVTPQNRYLVYVGQDTKLVEQWQFYTNATDTIPRFTTPWQNYKDYDGLKLSGDRGKMKLTEIEVPSSIPEKTFTEF